MEFETIIYDRTDAVATVTLNRPQALNAFTAELRSELRSALEIAAGDESVRAVLVQAAGKAFSVGQDLKELAAAYQDEGFSLGRLVTNEYAPLVETLQMMPKPTIALIQGIALGGGLSLALSCDFRVLGPDARLIAGFVNVGLAPDTGAAYLLPRMIGYARALHIFLTGKPLTAAEAVSLGLAERVHASAQDAASAAYELARTLANGPTLAYPGIRQLLHDTATLDLPAAMRQEAAVQERLSHTQDHRNAVSSFLERQPPQFDGQ